MAAGLPACNKWAQDRGHGSAFGEEPAPWTSDGHLCVCQRPRYDEDSGCPDCTSIWVFPPNAATTPPPSPWACLACGCVPDGDTSSSSGESMESYGRSAGGEAVVTVEAAMASDESSFREDTRGQLPHAV